MKKTALLMFTVLLAAACAGCGLLETLLPQPDIDPPPVYIPATADPTADPTPDPTPEPTPTPQAVDDSWKQIYADLFANNLTQSPYASSGWMGYYLQPGDLLQADADVLEEAYWITGALLCDLDGDGVPELFLNSGEVEYEMYYFTVRDGQVVYLNSCLSGNQSHTEALTLCRSYETGTQAYFSASLTGSGAGNYFELCRMEPDGTPVQLLSHIVDYDPAADAFVPMDFRVDGQAADEDAYAVARETLLSQWEAVATYEFTDLGVDPAAVLHALTEAYSGLK